MHTCRCYQIHHCNTALPLLLPSFLLLEDPSAHSPIQQQQLHPTPLLAWQLFFSLLSSPAALPLAMPAKREDNMTPSDLCDFLHVFLSEAASCIQDISVWSLGVQQPLIFGNWCDPQYPRSMHPPSTCNTGDMQLLNKFLLCHLHTILHARWWDKICNSKVLGAQQSSRESNHSLWKHFYQLSHVPRTEDVRMMKLEEGAQSRGQKNRL